MKQEMKEAGDADPRQRRAPIPEAMRAYAGDGALAFHTPGHKQGLGAHPLLRALITPEGLREEVSLMEELDDLHEPTMCIKEAETLAAELYGADHAYLMVNGTTGATHAMLLGTLSPGDVVLVPRNAHRSLIGGLVLAGAQPVYLQPEFDAAYGIPMGVAPETVRRALAAHPEARAVALVYPTYYGVTTDLAAIAAMAHARGALLLVDEAHGAHLRFSDALPPQAIDCGADAAAQSTHKLLGAMTQGSLLLTRGPRIDAERLREAASLLQTTSPNQLLMASIDIARLQMAEQGRALVGRAVRLAGELRRAVREIPGLKTFDAAAMTRPGASGLDVTKVTVSVRGLGLTGVEAEQLLRHTYKVQCELSDAENLLFIISYADTEREVARLAEALRALAREHARTPGKREMPVLPPVPETACAPRAAFFAAKERVPFDTAAGHIAAEQVMFYPPGVPLLAPGDRVRQAAIDYIRAMQRAGRKVVGPEDPQLRTLKVLREERERI